MVGQRAAEAPLVGGVRVEAIAPVREKHVFIDDADALPVLDRPGHGHAALSPSIDGADRSTDAAGGFPIREHRHGVSATL